MPTTYQQESLVTVEQEIKTLLHKHWEEIALHKDVIKLNPDWEAYAHLEDVGMLKIFTVREEGKLLGYFVVICRHHLHYMDHLFGFNDVLYLDQEYRKGQTGPDLIRFAESCLKEDGVRVLTINTKLHKPLDPLLEWMGYVHTENIFSKLL